MLLWHREVVVHEGKHVTLDRFADICDGGLAGLALRDATWETQTFGHPEAILTGINDHLSHVSRIPGNFNLPMFASRRAQLAGAI